MRNVERETRNAKQLETIIKISQTPDELAVDLAREMVEMTGRSALRKKSLSVALSGGSTPKLLYSVLGSKFADLASWKYVHFFWGDERCVPPDDSESNYRMAGEVLLNKIKIPKENIHRIFGENDPESEAVRYSQEIIDKTRNRNNLPVFDLVILGLGGDGHTASIFPGDNELLKSGKICAVAKHPRTGQKRITLTAPVINNADNIVFLVTGSDKAEVVAGIIENPGIVDYPAALIEPSHGILKWYLDMDAASMLSQWA